MYPGATSEAYSETRMRSHRSADSTLHVVLRNELDARKWSISQLARELDVKPGVASRWVALEPAKRVVPQPGTCGYIAKLLDLDAIEVLKAAGYVPLDGPVDGQAATDSDPRAAEIRAVKRRLGGILESVPAPLWGVALALTNVALDGLQSTLGRIEMFLNGLD